MAVWASKSQKYCLQRWMIHYEALVDEVPCLDSLLRNKSPCDYRMDVRSHPRWLQIVVPPLPDDYPGPTPRFYLSPKRQPQDAGTDELVNRKMFKSTLSMTITAT